jgi:hypothetical protein
VASIVRLLRHPASACNLLKLRPRTGQRLSIHHGFFFHRARAAFFARALFWAFVIPLPVSVPPFAPRHAGQNSTTTISTGSSCFSQYLVIVDYLNTAKQPHQRSHYERTPATGGRFGLCSKLQFLCRDLLQRLALTPSQDDLGSLPNGLDGSEQHRRSDLVRGQVEVGG